MNHLGKRLLYFAVPALAALTGCMDAGVSGRSTVPYVEEILSGENGALALFSDFDPRETRGSIALVGPYDSLLSARFLTVDDYDNIDARTAPDGLPDFAGEQIDIVEDADAAAYFESYGADAAGMRTAAVRNLVMSMESRCSIGAFDDEMNQEKLPAKMVVFTSPFNAVAGAFDIDTLCRHTGCSIPVVFPVRTVLEHQLDRNIEHLHVAVLTDSVTATSGVYQQLFDEISLAKGILGTGCVAFSRGSSLSMNSIIAGYKAAGGNMPVSALIIDDGSVQAEEVEASLEEIRNIQNEANLNSRKLITKDFVVVDMQKAVTDECYRILRKNNIFTHNIAYPAMKRYVTVKSSTGGGYNLVEKD